jgi:hypothetical protein
MKSKLPLPLTTVPFATPPDHTTWKPLLTIVKSAAPNTIWSPSLLTVVDTAAPEMNPVASPSMTSAPPFTMVFDVGGACYCNFVGSPTTTNGAQYFG